MAITARAARNWCLHVIRHQCEAVHSLLSMSTTQDETGNKTDLDSRPGGQNPYTWRQKDRHELRSRSSTMDWTSTTSEKRNHSSLPNATTDCPTTHCTRTQQEHWTYNQPRKAASQILTKTIQNTSVLQTLLLLLNNHPHIIALHHPTDCEFVYCMSDISHVQCLECHHECHHKCDYCLHSEMDAEVCLSLFMNVVCSMFAIRCRGDAHFLFFDMNVHFPAFRPECICFKWQPHYICNECVQ